MSKLTDISLQKLTSLKKMPPAQPAPEPKYKADEGTRGMDDLSLAGPHLFEEKRRFGCGCGCTWLLILALVAGAGGAASWYFLDAQDKVQIRNGISSLLGGTPLEFLRSFILPYMEAKPPVPPINESGDHGVITIPIKEKAPGLDPIQPKSEDQTGGQADGAQEEQPAEPQAQPEKEPLREDVRVRMPFISDLASYVVSQYKPGKSSSQNGILSITVQSLNQRYAKAPTGLDAGTNPAGRASLLRYCFNPSMIQGLYAIYADPFLRAVAAQAAEKKLSEAQTLRLYQTLAGRCLLLAGGLDAVTSMPDLARRLSELQQLEQACTVSNRQLLDARFDAERAQDTGASAAETARAKDEVARAQSALQAATQASIRSRERLVADLRTSNATSLNEDSLLYLARWVGRRVQDNTMALGGAKAAAQMLRVLAGRCSAIASQGLGSLTPQAAPGEAPAQAPVQPVRQPLSPAAQQPR